MPPVTIRFLTFNMGGTESMNWEIIFAREEWKSFFRVTESNIWIICTQEDLRESKFMKALGENVFTQNDYLWHTKTPTNVYLKKFHVHLGVFVPKSVHSYSLQHHTSLYHPSYYPDTLLNNMKNKVYHKSSAIIDVGRDIRVVGSHLPFNPKDESNARMRQRALNDILGLGAGKIMFVLGDLNFRTIGGVDQLHEIIGSTILANSSSRQIIDITKDIPFTCKTQKLKDIGECGKVYGLREAMIKNVKEQEYPTTPSTVASSFDNGLYPNGVDQKDKNIELDYIDSEEPILPGPSSVNACYVRKLVKRGNEVTRNISKCDRILMVVPDGFKDSVKEFGAEPLLIYPINLSDHNAVHGWVTIDDGMVDGGGVKKKKIHILGRERVLTKEGRCYMLTYMKKRITLGEARKLEKGRR